jgi:adenylate kinase family enzyme
LKRVLVIGSGGSGKTTFAAKLSRLTGLPLVHLDSHYWLPHWQKRPDEEWAAIVRDLVSRDSWIMDGNYGGSLDLRLEACDTVFFLDFPRLTCMGRALKRQFTHMGQSRPEMPVGCRERLDPEFLAWIWTYPAQRRPKILGRLAALEERKMIHVLRSDAEIDAYFASGP